MSKLLFQEQVEDGDAGGKLPGGLRRGNPFVDHHIQGVFTGEKETVRDGRFYDGGKVFIRFALCPSFEGATALP